MDLVNTSKTSKMRVTFLFMFTNFFILFIKRFLTFFYIFPLTFITSMLGPMVSDYLCAVLHPSHESNDVLQ